MKKFDVEITETLQRKVSVEAASQEDAERMVTQAWNNQDYVLDSSDFSAKLYRDRTEIKKKDKDGNWVTSVRPTTPADQRMRNYVMASKKAR